MPKARGKKTGPSGYTKVSQPTPRLIGPNPKKLWLINSKLLCREHHSYITGPLMGHLPYSASLSNDENLTRDSVSSHNVR